MKQEYNKFPSFARGEVLTSESLNASFYYNDEQTRLSRRYLSGYGIIEGLSYTYSSGKLQLQPGVCVTPDGHLVKIDETLVFNAALPCSSGFYEYDLCATTDKSTGKVPIPQSLDSYIVVLTAGVVEDSALHCSELTCDPRNVVKEIAVGLHLKKKIGSPTCTCDLNPIGETIRLKRLSGCVTNVNILNKKLSLLYKDNLGEVKKGLEYLCQIMNKGFTKYSKSLVPIKCWNVLFGDALGLSKQLFKAVRRYQDNWHCDMTEFPTYYFQHLEYLAVAINECLSYYNQFVQRYPVLSAGLVTMEDEVYLGMGNTSSDSIRYRSVFCAAHRDAVTQEARCLEHLLCRVVWMRKSFMGNNNFTGTVKLCMYDPFAPIGERPIPYFYKKNDNLQKYWRTPDCRTSISTMDYWSAPVNSNPANNSNERLFLQGCYRQKVDNVYKKVMEYIEENHLDISVEKVKACKKTLQGDHKGGNNNMKNHVARLKEVLKKNVLDIVKKNKPGNALYKALTDSGFTMNDWLSFVVAANQNNELKPSVVKAINESLGAVQPADCVGFWEIASGKSVSWGTNKTDQRHPTVTAILALKSYYEKCYNLDYDVAEYLQGCENGGKLLLFHLNGMFIYEATVKK